MQTVPQYVRYLRSDNTVCTLLRICLRCFHLLEHVQIHKDLPIVPVDPACKLEFSRNDTQRYTTVLTSHMVWGLWIKRSFKYLS